MCPHMKRMNKRVYARFYKGGLWQCGYIILNDTGGPNASRGGDPPCVWPSTRAGSPPPCVWPNIRVGGRGVPLAFRQIYEQETLAQLRSLPQCHSIYPSLLVTYLPCAHIKKKKFRAKRGVRPNPLKPPCIRP